MLSLMEKDYGVIFKFDFYATYYVKSALCGVLAEKFVINSSDIRKLRLGLF
jgi:hypothetical protein